MSGYNWRRYSSKPITGLRGVSCVSATGRAPAENDYGLENIFGTAFNRDMIHSDTLTPFTPYWYLRATNTLI